MFGKSFYAKAISTKTPWSCELIIWAVTCDLQQCKILTNVDSYEPVHPPYNLRSSKCCSVGSLILIKYASDLQRLWSDCVYAQADLRLCWSHIPHCWKSHVTAQLLFLCFSYQYFLMHFITNSSKQGMLQFIHNFSFASGSCNIKTVLLCYNPPKVTSLDIIFFIAPPPPLEEFGTLCLIVLTTRLQWTDETAWQTGNIK